MNTDLNVLANAVTDEPTFVEFMAALARDWDEEAKKEVRQLSSLHGPGANGWENGHIGSFLESAAAWASDTRSGTKAYTPPSNPWTRAAHILLAGKYYE